MKRYAAAVLLEDGKVLLGKRTATRSNYPGIWDFVGGHCERHETFEEALQRELQEEIGVKPTEMALLMIVDESPDFILNLFLVTAWDGVVQNMDELEHERIEWFDLHEAMQIQFMNGNYVEAIERLERIKTNRLTN
jgi:8-oxo-dGTP diphosphatase